MKNIAVIQCADTGPVESLALMLETVGLEPRIPDARLRDRLVGLGCDTVCDPAGLVSGMGYDPLHIETIGVDGLIVDASVLFEIKAHRNGPLIWKEWPTLKSRTIWYRINGGKPEITERGGDEINIPCPILTPNLWYGCNPLDIDLGDKADSRFHDANWGGQAYAMWPPFVRAGDYYARERGDSYSDPVCLIHGVAGWGYGNCVDKVRTLGVKFYGSHGSPDGLVQHSDVPELLSKALCMVHLKSNDCPGYSMYEAICAGCPLVIPRRLIRRMKMQELFVPDATCLVWDQEGDDYGRGPHDPDEIAEEIKVCIDRLRDPELNRTIGTNARVRLDRIMWNARRDGLGFANWLHSVGIVW